MLCQPEGTTLKEMAGALRWKKNSMRGAMSFYAKSEKKYCLPKEGRREDLLLKIRVKTKN